MGEQRTSPGEPNAALPGYLTRFVGRESELGTFDELLRDPAVHWITLTGPGGVGKTRLAIEAIRRALLHTANDRVTAHFVPLFGIDDSGLAIQSIARRLDPAATDTDPVVTIRSVAAGRRILLLLDNADGMVRHATAISSLLTLPECEQVTIIVTSRRPFNRAGEHLLPVAPLPLPDEENTDGLEASAAVRLFLDRANVARLDLTFSADDLPTIAHLCRRLDGLPLAIELSASKLRQLSLPVVAAKVQESRFSLEDTIAPHDLPGHLALRDSIASSFDLLSGPERDFLLRLSVFTGGISVEAGVRMAAGLDASDGYPFADGYGIDVYAQEYIGDIGLEDSPGLRARGLDLPQLDLDPVATLDHLFDQSLLQRTFNANGSARYQFLETINEFAQAELAASGQMEAVQHAKFAYMLALSEVTCEGLWVAHRRVVPIERLDEELTNLRGSLAWVLNQGSDAADLAVRLVDRLMVFFQMRGLLPEGISWLSRALELKGSREIRRVSGLAALGFACWMVGEIDRADALLTESLSLAPWGTMGGYGGRAHFFLALVAWRRGPEHAMKAVGHLQQALDLFKEWDDEIGQGVTKLALGEIVRQSGDHAGAMRLFNEAHENFVNPGYGWGAATAQWFLGEAERAAGNESAAAHHLALGMAGYQEKGDRLGISGCIAGLASLLAARQEWAMSARLFGAAATLKERTQSLLPPTHESDHAEIAEMVIRMIGAEAYLTGRADDADYTIAEAFRIAHALEHGESLVPDPLAQVKGYSRARKQVLVLLAEGKDVKEIALALDRGVSTIYRHIDALMVDLNCTTPAELRDKAQLIARSG